MQQDGERKSRYPWEVTTVELASGVDNQAAGRDGGTSNKGAPVPTPRIVEGTLVASTVISSASAASSRSYRRLAQPRT